MNESSLLKCADKRQAILLKNNGPNRVFSLRLGNLLLELWDYPRPTAEPYVSLTIGPGNWVSTEAGEMDESGEMQSKMILGPMQASVVVTAIQQWLETSGSSLKDARSPVLCAQIDSLTIKLYGRGKQARPRAEFSLDNGEPSQSVATLTCQEAGLLAGALGGLISDDEEGAQDP